MGTYHTGIICHLFRNRSNESTLSCPIPSVVRRPLLIFGRAGEGARFESEGADPKTGTACGHSFYTRRVLHRRRILVSIGYYGNPTSWRTASHREGKPHDGPFSSGCHKNPKITFRSSTLSVVAFFRFVRSFVPSS